MRTVRAGGTCVDGGAPGTPDGREAGACGALAVAVADAGVGIAPGRGVGKLCPIVGTTVTTGVGMAATAAPRGGDAGGGERGTGDSAGRDGGGFSGCRRSLAETPTGSLATTPRSRWRVIAKA